MPDSPLRTKLRDSLTAEQRMVGLAQDILDTLASGSEPYAATGYGYEHMGDFARDAKPLAELVVAYFKEPS